MFITLPVATLDNTARPGSRVITAGNSDYSATARNAKGHAVSRSCWDLRTEQEITFNIGAITSFKSRFIDDKKIQVLDVDANNNLVPFDEDNASGLLAAQNRRDQELKASRYVLGRDLDLSYLYHNGDRYLIPLRPEQIQARIDKAHEVNGVHRILEILGSMNGSQKKIDIGSQMMMAKFV